ncbi:MAG: hypothetical protein IT438_02090 [Phycisphaerales bacterium]|nr:hypothetical protein [Phycisphaerales bacterium]
MDQRAANICPGGPPVIIAVPKAIIKAWTDEVIDIVVEVYSSPDTGGGGGLTYHLWW